MLRSWPRVRPGRIPGLLGQGFTRRGVQTDAPLLYQQQEDGSETPINEHELFQYTRYRWLTNDTRNRASRFRKFDLNALQQAAISAAGGGAAFCVKMVKCVEGQYNKAFLLTMNNGVEVIAKLPNPNAGPEVYTTASEVATCRFVRDVLEIPVPRVYSYSVDSSGPVGAEYIIQEKAKGVPLGKVWHQWSLDSQRRLVEQVVHLEERLASVSFREHGCLYLKNDPNGRLTQSNTAGCAPEIEYSSRPSSQSFYKKSLQDFQMVPLTTSEAWDNGRANLKMDNGPWQTHQDYMTTLGDNELEWAKTNAKPRMNYYRSQVDLEKPEEYILLLEKYLRLVPLIASLLCQGSVATSLYHPDLHLDNIFVDEESTQISSIIDWQSAAIKEPFFQPRTPRFIIGAGSSDTGQLPDDDAAYNGSKNVKELLQFYHLLSRSKNPKRYDSRNHKMRSVIIQPSLLVTGAWSRRDMASLRQSLIRVLVYWDEIFPEGITCPIDFTKEELAAHEVEMENMTGIGEALRNLDATNQIPLGGVVPSEYYDEACRINDHMKNVFKDLAEDDAQRIWFSKLWPYQDDEDMDG